MLVKGTEASETLNGSQANNILFDEDTIYGYGGHDTIFAWGGDDKVYGGDGNDVLHGGYGADLLDGGDDIDTVDYSEYASDGVYVNLATGFAGGGPAEGDTIVNVENVTGTDWTDIFVGDGGPNVLKGLWGNDSLKGGGGDDTLEGGYDQDTLEGGAGADVLRGGSGGDTASYRSSNAAVFVSLGGLGTVAATGGHADGDTLSSIEHLTGSDHNDTLWGNDVGNELTGLGGQDTLKGFGGSDTLRGGDGLDSLLGGDGDDTISGDGGNDWINGDADRDTISGGAGVDSISGGSGNDLVAGGTGNDKLWGDDGQDRFLFDTALNAATNVDVINDFTIVDDTIQLDADIFSSSDFTVNNSVAGSQFVIGTAALDGGDRIIYNPATGAVYYDSDGTGAAAAIQFATLSPGLALTNHDFYVIA